MPVDILLAITVVAVIQSIFGVGMLLFGTPILLLLGYSFVDTLSVLLPISIAISTLQLLKHHEDIDFGFFKNVLIYSIPLIVLFLALVSSVKINIGPVIGALLIFIALKNFSGAIERLLKSIVKYERIYLMTVGVVHGLTNLGGSLLTVIIYGKQYPKDRTRVTAAASYATFALFQLLTLLIMHSQFSVSYDDRVTFVQVGIIVYLITEKLLYKTLDNEKYNKLFGVFLFISGIMLILKSL